MEVDDVEQAHRFLRTAHFLVPGSCFNSSQRQRRCCSNLGRAPRGCFDIWKAPHLCCHKARPRQPSESLTSRALLEGGPESGCAALADLAGAGITAWMERLLQLPKDLQAPCIAGSMANRLQAVSLSSASRALRRLRVWLVEHCPSRRALAAMRRNLLFWEKWHRSSGSCSRIVQNLTHALEACRAKFSQAPVLQVHIAKTAGSSLCSWANTSGFASRRLPDLRCQLPGDGPFWLGEKAAPATCQQRLRELARHNLSWSSIERWLDLPLCEELQYVAALRLPVTRTLHHFVHLLSFHHLGRFDLREKVDILALRQGLFHKVLRPPQWLLQDTSAQGGGHAGFRWPASTAQLRDWLQLWHGMASNYQVRSLAGAAGGLAYLEDCRGNAQVAVQEGRKV
ncbi:CYP704B1 [Symbiodinium natans]|uniref:CYP704B1 protein n=1 Tax=Symbiodinium natans TaxID=878477 RepID=A0A812ML83_9DINO|nr:CYP704B1 [Symbiodinium natans]